MNESDAAVLDESGPIIEVTGLDVSYGRRRILHDVDFRVEQGEIRVIMGGSGSGKSTLLRHLLGLHRPTGGCVKVFGIDIARASRRQIVVAGFEAHVCVAQSALDLIVDDLDVYVVADATSSRREEDRALALERLRQAGAAIVSSEMVAFEWLERADTAAFKDLIQMIRDRS